MKVAVYGSASGAITKEVQQRARYLGNLIAKLDHTLITGACHGIPLEAVHGAAELSGQG